MATRKYELMVILDPVRTDDQHKETLDKIDETIKKYGGTPDKREIWGKRRLAYSISKRRDGFYALVYFDAEPTSDVLSEVERVCKYGEEILRHLVTIAVVGKAPGNPALMVAEDRAPRPYQRRGGPRRDEGSYGAPAAPPVAAPAAAVPVAEVAPAVEAAPAETPAE